MLLAASGSRFLYLGAGWYDFPSLDHEYPFDLLKRVKTWKVIARMFLARSEHAMFSLAHLLAIAGRADGELRSDNISNESAVRVDALDELTGKWGRRASLLKPRIEMSSCSLGHFGYVIGGFSAMSAGGAVDRRGRAVASVERYGLETGAWQEVAPMVTVRYKIAACSALGKVFVAGGRPCNPSLDPGDILVSVEVYDPEIGIWVESASMREPWAGMAACASKGLVYVFCGWRKGHKFSYDVILKQFKDIVEGFDISSGHWHPHKAMGVDSGVMFGGEPLIGSGLMVGVTLGSHSAPRGENLRDVLCQF